MTRHFADSTVAAYLPEGMDGYLGYIDGRYQSYTQIKARFPRALVVPIATQASGDVGTVGDGPPDNGTWSQWVAWVVRRRRAGADPTMNTTASEWAAGVNAFNAAGVAQPHWWISSWNNVQDIPAGAVAHQYVSHPNRYDESVVADYWPGVDPAPAPPRPPAPAPAPAPPAPPGPGASGPGPQQPTSRVKTMLLFSSPAGIWLLSGALYAHVTSPADAHAIEGAGVPVVSIDQAQHTAILAAYTNLTRNAPAVGIVPVSQT